MLCLQTNNLPNVSETPTDGFKQDSIVQSLTGDDENTQGQTCHRNDKALQKLKKILPMEDPKLNKPTTETVQQFIY